MTTQNFTSINMEQAYIIARLKEMTVPELLEALAEAYAGDPLDIYEYLQPDLIDKTTDALADFREMVKRVKR